MNVRSSLPQMNMMTSIKSLIVWSRRIPQDAVSIVRRNCEPRSCYCFLVQTEHSKAWHAS